jgi:ADP-heptose:LPS heptosyltransferase/GT2 family glycosyltransferase
MIVRYRSENSDAVKVYNFGGKQYKFPAGKWISVNDLFLFEDLKRYPDVFDVVAFFDIKLLKRVAKDITIKGDLISTSRRSIAEKLKKFNFIRYQAEKPEQGTYIFKILNYGGSNLSNYRGVRRGLNILAYRNLGGLGDIIMTTSAIEKVKEEYPNSQITYACPKEFMEVLENNPMIDRLTSWNRKITQEEYDVVINLTHDCIDYEIKHQPLVERNRPEVFVSSCGLSDGKVPKPKVYLCEDEILWGKDFLKGFSGFVIGLVLKSNANVRQWPYFKELRTWLLQKYPTAVLLEISLDRPSDWKEHSRVVPIFGFDIREVATLINQCDLVISPDTGIAHISGALNRPTVWLFTHIDGKIRTKNYPDSFVCQTTPRNCLKGMPCWYEIPCGENVERKKNPACAVALKLPMVTEMIERILLVPHISYIVVYHNGEEYTQRCLERVVFNMQNNDELIIIDNGSFQKNHFLSFVKNLAVKTQLLRNEKNLGCIKARNQGLERAWGRYILFIDSDQLMSPISTHSLMSIGADIVGTEAWSMDEDGYAFDMDENRGPLAYVGAGGMMVRRSIMNELKGFDEVYSPAWFEDPDICFRAKKLGYTIGYHPDPKIEHLAHQTIGSQRTFNSDKAWNNSHKIFMEQWRGKLSRRSIHIYADVIGWAWDIKAQEIVKRLSEGFNLELKYLSSDNISKSTADVLFTFDCAPGVIGRLNGKRYITGATAQVYKNYPNWEESLKRAIAIHANSKMLFEEIKHLNDKSYYLPNGVDERLFLFEKRDLNDTFRVGYVGKPSTPKGLGEYIIPACKKAGVVLKQQTCYYQSSNCIDHRLMPGFYKDIDVILIASTLDGTPNMLLEAASVGRTFIGNKIGNVPEFVQDKVNGFCIEERNVDDYVDRLLWLKSHREQCAQMGVEARKTIIENWTWDIQVENYKELFEMVLSI